MQHAAELPRHRFAFEGFAEGHRMRHRVVEAGAVEFAFPAAHDDGGDAVADEVGERRGTRS
jgi:hypothetical protein